MTATEFPSIEIERIRLGMYVLLDLGWRNHPFLRNRFMLRTPEQLQQLRALGLKTVRYCPDRSEQAPLPVKSIEIDAGSQTGAAQPIEVDRSTPSNRYVDVKPLTEAEWERDALQRVEAEYDEMSQAHRRLISLLPRAPRDARKAADSLAQTLYQTIADCDLPAVRLLSEHAGRQASGHEMGVSALSVLLARECGMDTQAQKDLALASLLHDMGKLHLLPQAREDHPALSESERKNYKEHVALGLELARSMDLSAEVSRAIAEHPEYADSSSGAAADVRRRARAV